MISINQQFASLRAFAKAAGSIHLSRILRGLFAAACLCAGVSQSEAGLKIYYIRHAEGGHNVVKEWENTPKEQRPDYVGNADVFTPKGKTQAVAAVDKLKQYHYDHIIVSPLWRTRNTVLPYLKATGAKGEIWPELAEFSGGLMILATNLPKHSAKIIGAGARVELPADEAAYFSLRKGATNHFKLSPKNTDQREADIRFVLQRVVDRIGRQFGGTDQSLLLVGHGNSGKALLKLLTKDPLADTLPMVNTGIWMVEEQPNGRWNLKIYNDAPYEKKGATSDSKR